MTAFALSTMYAQQPRFDDGGVFARYAADAGYDGLEFSHSTDCDKVEQIIADGALPILSVHGPAPARATSTGKHNTSLNLASLDERERSEAVRHHIDSIELAARVGATTVVVHIGATTEKVYAEELEMKRLFGTGARAAAVFDGLRASAIFRRDTNPEPFVDAARRSVGELVAQAAPRGITLGLENRYHFHEIPRPAEYRTILEGFNRDEVGFWLDTGHAEVMHRLGFIDLSLWLEDLIPNAVGAHLTDVAGVNDHLAPGAGEASWAAFIAGLQHLERFTLEINQHQPDADVVAAPKFLRSAGLG